MTHDDYRREIEVLNRLQELETTTAVDLSVIYQIKGQYYYELGDTANAIASFESAISAGGLSNDEIKQLRNNLSALNATHVDEKQETKER